jgi:uncharacterized protein Yka (UPF0111/DUF47 family)
MRRRLEVAGVRGRRWFLPESPDVLGLLHDQLGVTLDGMEAFAGWAAGDAAAARVVRDREHAADEERRRLHRALRSAFVTPLDPEDLFAVSRGVDRILNQAKDLVREAEVMGCAPDPALAEMAALLRDAMARLQTAIGRLDRRGADAIEPADAAIADDRRVERVYRRAMAELLAEDDLREVIARRELYRRCSRMGETVVDVAERVLYAWVKES